MTRSFIVYCNNSQKYIAKLLQSILEQIDENPERKNRIEKALKIGLKMFE